MRGNHQPDLMFAFKRPIKDLESKPWPDFDLPALLTEEQGGQPFYYARFKSNGKDVTYNIGYK